MYGAVSLVGWSLYALFKLLAGILKLTWWIGKSVVKGIISLVKLARGTSRQINVRALSERGITDLLKVRQEDLRTFDRHCRQYAVNYAIPKGQKGKNPIEVLILHNDLSRIKRITEKMDVAKAVRKDAPLKEASDNQNASVVEQVENIKKSLADRASKNIEKGVLDR